MLGYYNYTVILTYVGMLAGFFGITYAIEQNFFVCVVFLMIAGFCDMFDGAVASTRDRTRKEKDFGIQIDSLSDLICFGVLPAILIYAMNGRSRLVLAISGLYVLATLIRLSYFNVDEMDRQTQTDSRRETYLGLPVTTSALVVPLTYAIGTLAKGSTGVYLSASLVVMGICFLTPFKLKKPHLAGKIMMIVVGFVELALMIWVMSIKK